MEPNTPGYYWFTPAASPGTYQLVRVDEPEADSFVVYAPRWSESEPTPLENMDGEWLGPVVAVAVYHAVNNEYKSIIRPDNRYVPSAGYTLHPVEELGNATLEEDTSQADLIAAYRAKAKELLDAQAEQLALLRATVLTSLDEVNLLRQWITDFKTQVAAATNLADLKTRVAGLSNMPQRTAQQARDAIKGKIDTGDADS